MGRREQGRRAAAWFAILVVASLLPAGGGGSERASAASVEVAAAVHSDTGPRLRPAMAAGIARSLSVADAAEREEADAAERDEADAAEGEGADAAERDGGARSSVPGGKFRDPVPEPTDAGGGADPVLQATMPAAKMPETAPAWGGLGSGFGGPDGAMVVAYAPPDTDGDVGRRHYVQVVSATMVVYDKATATPILGPVPIRSLWSGFGGPCELDHADSVVRYDQLADRWLLARPTVGARSGPYLLCVAVSATPDPTGAWHRYAFEYDAIPDYAKLSVWPDAYVATYNTYDASETFVGARACALERSAMLSGKPASQQCVPIDSVHHSLLAADLDGPTPPPTGTPIPLLALGRSSDSVDHWSFAVDWADPRRTRLSERTRIGVPAYSYPCGTGGICVPQPETPTLLDTMGDRLMARLSYRVRGSTATLLVAHTVTTPGATGVRWYELRQGTRERVPTLRQAGTWAPDGRYRWLPSIAGDGSGNIALGYSLGGLETYPSVAIAGRLAADPAGELTQAERVVVAGGGSQTGSGGGRLTRWGDYASMTVDPIDECTFYFTTEYLKASGSFNWSTSISSFRFPSCVAADGSPWDPPAPAWGTTAGSAGGSSTTASSPATGTSAGSGTTSGAAADGGSPGGSATGGVAGVVCTAPCADGGSAPILPVGTIASVTPRTGGPGTTLAITGRDLAGAREVWIGGYPSPRVVVLSPSRILASIPAGAASGKVAVEIGEGTAFGPGRYTVRPARSAPRIEVIGPLAARTGATVTISGANLVGVTRVLFGGVAARSITVVDATTLVAVVPTGARSGRVSVRSAGGTGTSAESFTVLR